MKSLACLASLVVALAACGGGGDGPITVIDAANNGDGGGLVCDPLAPAGAQGCAANEKCTWIRVQGTSPNILGKLGCVRDGTVDAGGTCNYGAIGESTGFDDCRAGLICIGAGPGVCQDICGFDGSARAQCEANFACTRYRSIFTNNGQGEVPLAGACNATCDPLTQTQTGNGQPCGTNRGCYLLSSATETTAVCVNAGTRRHGEVVDPPSANACLPFHAPRVANPAMPDVFECGALCAPADVTAGTNVASEGGIDDGSGMPKTCEAQGASPPDSPTTGESCRYWYARERFTTGSPFSNTVGWCLKHVLLWRDTDGDMTGDAPVPRCIDIEAGGDTLPPVGVADDVSFWCVQRPPSLFQRSAAPRSLAPEASHDDTMLFEP